MPRMRTWACSALHALGDGRAAVCAVPHAERQWLNNLATEGHALHIRPPRTNQTHAHQEPACGSQVLVQPHGESYICWAACLAVVEAPPGPARLRCRPRRLTSNRTACTRSAAAWTAEPLRWWMHAGPSQHPRRRLLARCRQHQPRACRSRSRSSGGGAS